MPDSRRPESELGSRKALNGATALVRFGVTNTGGQSSRRYNKFSLNDKEKTPMGAINLLVDEVGDRFGLGHVKAESRYGCEI